MDPPQTHSSATRHTLPFIRQHQPPARDTQPWTTTRCNRLLRPLKTHISALRREVELEDSHILSDDCSGDGVQGTVGRHGSKNCNIQQTYSRRGRKPAAATKSQAAPRGATASKTNKISTRRTSQPGEIVLPTPFIRRARGQQLSSPVQQPVLKGRVSNVRGKQSNRLALRLTGSPGGVRPPSLVSALEVEMLPLRSRVPATRFALYESILRALHALLIATQAPSASILLTADRRSASTRSKSLMAMCLRKIPEYIGELEYWDQRDAEENGTKSTLQSSDVSSQVYGALEDILPSSRGCPQLRVVVREHGMKLVRDALAEGLLDDSYSLLLIALCFRTKAHSEAEGLLELILDRSYPKPKGVDSTFEESRRLAPLKTLRDFARETGRPQFMLRQLSKLITSQQLPLDWLSTKEFASVWSGVVKTLSGEAVCDDSVTFAVHFITSLASKPKKTAFTLRSERGDLNSLSQQTLLSAISVLVSLTLLRQEAKHLSTHNPACAISKRVGYTIEACITEMKRSRTPGWIFTILNLSAHLASGTQSGPKKDVSGLWRRILQDRNKQDGKQHYEAVTFLICSLASCCARGTAEPPHYYLTKLFRQLDAQASAEEGDSWKLRVDCAFFLAERTNDMRDLAFAESCSSAASPQSKSASTTPRKTSISSETGFRWDGDISEWVTATPAPDSRRKSAQTEYSSPSTTGTTRQDETDDDSDDGSPKRWTRSSMTRRGHGARQQQPPPQDSASAVAGLRLRKRSLAVTGLLSIQPSDSEEESEEGEQGESDELARTSRMRVRRISGQENQAGLLLPYADPKKRRRVSAADAAPLRPRRAVLRTVTNTCHGDLSEDELGL